MQDQNYKCSKHKDIDAIRCCGECNAFYCNKCEKFHSEIHKNHQTFQIDKDTDELFTGFCQEKNHQNKMEIICIDHNTFCCGLCIAKIKTREYGKHFDCNVYDINDI